MDRYAAAFRKALEEAEANPTAKGFRDCASLLKAIRKPNEELVPHLNDEADGLGDVLRAAIYRSVPQMSVDDMRDSMETYKLSLFMEARERFESFLIYVEWNRDASKRFYLPRQKALKVVVDDLQALADGDIDFLGISMPPRVGKSTICIFFMAWIMGRMPDEHNVMSGHSSELTKSFYEELMTIFRSEEYLYSDVFPVVGTLKNSAENTTISLGRRKRYKTVTCRSIGGALTGTVEISERGILYCDDLVKDREEAASEVRLQKLYADYCNVLKDRKKDGARELMIGTRWNVFDPLGRVREQYQDDPRYRFRVLPALDANGESNFDFSHGLGFSTRYYEDMRETLIQGGEEALWWAKYMGQPYIREGLLFPRDEMNVFLDTPDREPDAVFAVCDTKERGADFACMPICEQYGDEYYVVDVMCDDGVPEKTQPKAAALLCQHKVQMCRFESNNAGGRFADAVKALVSEKGGRCSITKKHTQANKETKIIMQAGFILERFWFRDPSLIKSGTDYDRYMRMLSMYTLAGRNAHDDAPDATAMLAELAQNLHIDRAKPIPRPW